MRAVVSRGIFGRVRVQLVSVLGVVLFGSVLVWSLCVVGWCVCWWFFLGASLPVALLHTSNLVSVSLATVLFRLIVTEALRLISTTASKENYSISGDPPFDPRKLIEFGGVQNCNKSHLTKKRQQLAVIERWRKQ